METKDEYAKPDYEVCNCGAVAGLHEHGPIEKSGPHYPGSRPGDYYDRSKQPRCNICGQFAYWCKQWEEWRLKCTSWNYELGWEHD